MMLLLLLASSLVSIICVEVPWKDNLKTIDDINILSKGLRLKLERRFSHRDDAQNMRRRTVGQKLVETNYGPIVGEKRFVLDRRTKKVVRWTEYKVNK